MCFLAMYPKHTTGIDCQQLVACLHDQDAVKNARVFAHIESARERSVPILMFIGTSVILPAVWTAAGSITIVTLPDVDLPEEVKFIIARVNKFCPDMIEHECEQHKQAKEYLQ